MATEKPLHIWCLNDDCMLPEGYSAKDHMLGLTWFSLISKIHSTFHCDTINSSKPWINCIMQIFIKFWNIWKKIDGETHKNQCVHRCYALIACVKGDFKWNGVDVQTNSVINYYSRCYTLHTGFIRWEMWDVMHVFTSIQL